MVPYVVIGVVTLVGLVGWGFQGAIIAFALAWIGSWIVGAVAVWVSEGHLPRQVRQDAARSYLETFPEIADAAFPSLTQDQKQKAIEIEIDRICQTSKAWSTSLIYRVGKGMLNETAQELCQNETDPVRVRLISSIAEHLERTWYQPSQ